MLESRLAADDDRISELEHSVIEAKQESIACDQLLFEVIHTAPVDVTLHG